MTFRINCVLFFISLFFLYESVKAQELSRTLSLEEVIVMAREQSLQGLLARHRFRSSYWEYRTYVARFRPSLNLEATIPDLNRAYDRIILPTGEESFVERSSLNSDVELSLRQNVGFTGGTLFMNSGLQRIDILSEGGETSYLSTPLSVGFVQPISGFNIYKWQRKIEPLKYEEAKKRYLESMEGVAIRAIDYFFDLALAQINLEIARINFENADTLYKIAEGRYNIGTIAENELLQMELGTLNAGTALNEANIELEAMQSQLRSFLGFNENVNLTLLIPAEIPATEIEFAQAYDLAVENNPNMLALEREVLESDRNVAEARSERGLNADLFASFGLTERANTIPKAYQNPQDQQRVRLGLMLPIVDWGLNKGNYKMALSGHEVVRTQVAQEKIDFEQAVFLQIMRFNLQDDQFYIAAKADTIAQLRYDVTKQRFLIGKIDVLDLNVALNEKDVARRAYVQALRNYWNYFYTIRRLTLYDFVEEVPLQEEYDDLIE